MVPCSQQDNQAAERVARLPYRVSLKAWLAMLTTEVVPQNSRLGSPTRLLARWPQGRSCSA